MHALSVLVILSAVSVIAGECVGSTATTCSGDATACDKTAFCYWNEAESGSCNRPSCSANSRSTCTAITNCEWRSTGSRCSRPSYSDCEDLTESACKAVSSGCRWVAASSKCSGPTYGQCNTKTQAECQGEESGCIWQYYSYPEGRCEMDYDACSGLSPTGCNDKTGCTWYPGTCNYTGCDSLGENACKANNNCYYSPPRGSCRAPPQSDSCTNLNPTLCKSTPSCRFMEDQTYCSSNNGMGNCNSPQLVDGQLVCGEGCIKTVSFGRCEPDYVYCSNNAENTGCDASSLTNGCFWDPSYQRGFCGFDYHCEKLSQDECYSTGNCNYNYPQGSCISDPKLEECTSLSADVCSSTDYCELSGESYSCINSETSGTDGCYQTSDGEGQTICVGDNCVLTRTGECFAKQYYCGNYGPTDCSASGGCIWEGDSGGCVNQNYAPPEPGDRRLGDEESLPLCESNEDNTACKTGSPSGCSFSGGSCSTTSFQCAKSPSGNECDQASKSAGCVWKPGNGSSGYCSSNSWPKCYKNTEGTGCDVSSSASSCSFQSSPGYCTADYTVVCSVKADGTGCDTSSLSGGCKWIADGGTCDSPLKCYKNSNGDGCDTVAGDTGCTWDPPTPAGCYSVCFPNATGNGCDEESIEEGCVWKDGSAASIVRIPMILLLVLLVFGAV